MNIRETLDEKHKQELDFGIKQVHQQDTVLESWPQKSTHEAQWNENRYFSPGSVELSHIGHRRSFIRRIKSLRLKVREERVDMYSDELIDEILNYYLGVESSPSLSLQQSPLSTETVNFSVESKACSDVGPFSADSNNKHFAPNILKESLTQTSNDIYESFQKLKDSWYDYWFPIVPEVISNAESVHHSLTTDIPDFPQDSVSEDNQAKKDHKKSDQNPWGRNSYIFDYLKGKLHQIKSDYTMTQSRLDNAIIKIRKPFEEHNIEEDNDIMYIRNESLEEINITPEPTGIFTRIKSIRLKKSFLSKRIQST